MNNLYEGFMKSQMTLNDIVKQREDLMMQQIGFLLEVLEDHERDMMRMAEEINNLKRQIEK